MSFGGLAHRVDRCGSYAYHEIHVSSIGAERRADAGTYHIDRTVIPVCLSSKINREASANMVFVSAQLDDLVIRYRLQTALELAHPHHLGRLAKEQRLLQGSLGQRRLGLAEHRMFKDAGKMDVYSSRSNSTMQYLASRISLNLLQRKQYFFMKHDGYAIHTKQILTSANRGMKPRTSIFSINRP